MKRKTILKVLTIVLAVSTLCIAVYIIWHRLGLNPDYDFGAGAYYYADDPAIQEKVENASYTTSVPKWVHYTLFFVWGAIVWALWKWVDRRK